MLRHSLHLREVRKHPFALWARTVEEAWRLLPGPADRLVGLVVTPGDSPRVEPLEGGLLHLTLPAEVLVSKEVVRLLLDMLEQLESARQEVYRLNLELERWRNDLQRHITEQVEFRENLMREIAERRTAEEAARHSQRWLEAIYDSVSEGITLHDLTTGVVLEGNRCARRMMGREDLEGLPLEDLVATPAALDELRSAGEEPRVLEWALRGTGEDLLWVEASLRRTLIGGREVVLVTCRDITERRAAEQERRRLENQIQHTQRLESLGVLAGGVAHDFNNLLMAIQGNVELAMLDLEADSPVRVSLREALRASQSASDLCGQILSYSGRGCFDMEPLDLSLLVSELGRMFGASILNKASLVWNLDADLPQVMGDAIQLRQIAMNLILNAAEAVGEQPGEIRISTRLHHCTHWDLGQALLGELCQPGDFVALEVEDTGCGMDETTLRRIFEPFFTTKVLGRGLGLAAVLGIVRGHRGALRVDSKPGIGTRFRVLLPPFIESVEPSSPESGSGESPAVWSGTGTILVVDDEELLRTLLTQILERHGFQVLQARDGQEALRVFQGLQRIDLVLLDLRMPRMDGFETCQALRALDSKVPILMMSGHQDSSLVAGKATLGIQGVLQKPFQSGELRDLLRQVLDPANLQEGR
ncbi:MAG: hybrid sensor histidine kinase/response regulator [Candidatus Xenobium sp.]|nr:response regulator [Burkholderiales bacterium]